MSKIKITDLSAKAENLQTLETLSDRETIAVVGGTGDGEPIFTLPPLPSPIGPIKPPDECPPMPGLEKPINK